MIHGDLKGQNIHIPYSFEYATAAARDAATGLTVNDEGKFCRILADNTIWLLASSSPLTWVGIASGVGSGSTAVASSGTTFPPAPLNYEIFYRTDLDNVFIWNPIVSAWIDVTAANVSGDMFKVTYDPTNVNANAFAMDNMAQGTFNLFVTPLEKSLIASAELVSNKGAASGYASLDANTEVVQLPAGASAAAAGAVLQQDGQWVIPTSSGGTGSGISVYTQAQINGLTPTDGLTVYNSTTGFLQVYSTSAGLWNNVKYDTGVVLPTSLNTQLVTANLTLDPAVHEFIEISATTTSVAITLPDAAANNGKQFKIKATDLTFPASVSAPAGSPIDIYSSYNFAIVGEAITVVSDGLEWEIISSHKAPATVDLTNIQQEISDNTYNTLMNSYRIMSYDAMSKYKMVDGIMDEYLDLVDVNSANSSYGYDSAGNFLFNNSSNPIIDNYSMFGTSVHFGTIQNAVGNVGGSNPGETFQIHGDQTITAIKVKIWNHAANPFDPTGTGTLSMMIIKLPAGQSINTGTDRPTWSDFHNPALLMAQADLTEAYLAANTKTRPLITSNLLAQNEWVTWTLPTPTLFPDGDYAFVLDRITNPIIGWYEYSDTISSIYSEGRGVSTYTSGTVLYSHNRIYSIEAKSDTVSNNPVMNRSHTNSVFTSNSNNPAWGTGLHAIPFRLTTNTLIESVKLSFISTPSYPMDGTGAGSYRFAIQGVNTAGAFVDTGGVAEKTALKKWGSAIDPAYDLISETLTEPQLAAISKNYPAEPYMDNFAAIKVDLAANNQVPFSVVNFTNPTTLPPGEYFIIIDNVTNPISQILYYLEGRAALSTVDSYIGGGTQEVFASGLTSVYALDPLFAIGGKSLGNVSNMIVEGVANTVTTSPTKLYFSAIVNSSILLTDLNVEVSKDNGATWNSLILSEIQNSNNTAGTKMIYATYNFASTTGTQVMYRVSSLNLTSAELHASSLQWR